MAHDTRSLPQSHVIARAVSVERTFSRTSWAMLLLALLLLGLSSAQKVYRLRLPTDGWQPEVGAPNLTYERDMLGLPGVFRSATDPFSWVAWWHDGTRLRKLVYPSCTLIALAFVPLQYSWNLLGG